MTTATLTVPDISCAHCERTITNTLTPVQGVQSVSVDIPQKKVQVAFDAAQVSLAQMAALLAEEDYPVASVEAAEATANTRRLPLAQDTSSDGCACCSPAQPE